MLEFILSVTIIFSVAFLIWEITGAALDEEMKKGVTVTLKGATYPAIMLLVGLMFINACAFIIGMICLVRIFWACISFLIF